MASSPSTQLHAALPIETERLRLRRFRPDDLDAFVAYRSLEAIYRYQSWPRPFGREHGRELIAEMAAGSVLRPGAWFQIAIAARQTDAMIGDIGVHTSAEPPWVFELGFSIAPAHQRRGLATEALRAWLAILASQDRAQSVLGVVDRRNAGSRSLLEALGFELDHSEDAEYFGERCLDDHYELRF